MRHPKKAIVVAAAANVMACGVGGLACQAAENILPIRKTGHWQITSVAETIGMKVLDVCVGPNDSILPTLGDKCDSPEIKRSGKEMIVNQRCRTDQGTQLSSNLLSGDYQKWYRVVGKMTFDPPQGGVHTMGLSITAKYISEKCPQPSASTQSQ